MWHLQVLEADGTQERVILRVLHVVVAIVAPLLARFGLVFSLHPVDAVLVEGVAAEGHTTARRVGDCVVTEPADVLLLVPHAPGREVFTCTAAMDDEVWMVARLAQPGQQLEDVRKVVKDGALLHKGVKLALGTRGGGKGRGRFIGG